MLLAHLHSLDDQGVAQPLGTQRSVILGKCLERDEYTRRLKHSSSKLVAEAESVFIDPWEGERLLLSNNSVLEEGSRTRSERPGAEAPAVSENCCDQNGLHLGSPR